MNPKLLTRLAATSLPASLHPSLQIAGSWPASITDRRQSVVEMPQPTAMDYYAEYRLALILDIQIRPRVSVAAPRPTYPCSSLMSIVDLKIIDAGGLDSEYFLIILSMMNYMKILLLILIVTYIYISHSNSITFN